MLTPKGKSAHDTLLKQTTSYLMWLEEYRKGMITVDGFRARVIKQFLTPVPDGAWLGGTEPEYAPRPSVTGSVISGIGNAGRWVYDAGAAAWKWLSE